MWTDFELSKLGELYAKLPDETIEQFFPSFIIDAIKAEEGKAYVNLRRVCSSHQHKSPTLVTNITLTHYKRNHFFVPKHKRDRKTLRFVRLMTDFNVGSWLGEILKYLYVSVDMRIQIGFSFVARKGNTEPTFIYYFAAPDLASYDKTFEFTEDALKFAAELENTKHSDFLSETFFEKMTENIFAQSGIRPDVLIACYFWITK